MEIHPYTPHKEHEPMLHHHKATWHGITRLMLYSVVGVVVLLSLMAAFLVKRFS